MASSNDRRKQVRRNPNEKIWAKERRAEIRAINKAASAAKRKVRKK